MPSSPGSRKSPLKRFLAWTVLATFLLLAGLAIALFGSLPNRSGTIRNPLLTHPVRVDFDAHAIPTIHARSREDALFALGYLAAEERLFQMEFMRLAAAGRLGEVLGKPAVESDRLQRTLDLPRHARRLLDETSEGDRRLLRAHAAGINASLAGQWILPPELLLLFHRPARWSEEDSLLLLLFLFENISCVSEDEKMATVLYATFPPSLAAFLMPSTDAFETLTLENGPAKNSPLAPPRELIREFLNKKSHRSAREPREVRSGASNCWVVSGKKTRSGRPLLANDLHLGFSVPNLWYRANVNYGPTQVSGFYLPGLPVCIIGATNHIAWGFASLGADTVDLIRLERDPRRPGHYLTSQGSLPYEKKRHRIKVRGQADVDLETSETIWGPVLNEDLLGSRIAFQWTALKPGGTNLALLRMESARSAKQAVEILKGAGIPPMSALVADADDHIAWTIAGRIPARPRGATGFVSVPSGKAFPWDGFIAPQSLPSVFDPDKGYLVAANNRPFARESFPAVGHNFNNSSRARRIAESLARISSASESDFLALQSDDRSDFYAFYRDLAADATSDRELQALLKSWDGFSRRDSVAFPLIFEFQRLLQEAVMRPFYDQCAATQKNFSPFWLKEETAVRRLLAQRSEQTVPPPFRTWKELLAAVLGKARETLAGKAAKNAGHPLTWGELNRGRFRHPFSDIPVLGDWLSLPPAPQSGSLYSVHYSCPGAGATCRLVVTPGRREDGLAVMPGGQSGHFLSRNYRDQQELWLEGKALDLTADRTASPPVSTLILSP